MATLSKRIKTFVLLSLQAEQFAWGVLSDLVVTCTLCQYQRIVSPGNMKISSAEVVAPDPPQHTRSKTPQNKRYNRRESKFKSCPINYHMILLTQYLGCGLDTIGHILAFFGITPARGRKTKWKTLQDAVGAAENQLYKEICKENIKLVIANYQERAEPQLAAFQGTEEEKEAKRCEILRVVDGRIGIDAGVDGAWQKRAGGFGSYNSLSGMNFCGDLETKLIINLVVYAKKCTYCERCKSRHLKSNEGVAPAPPMPPVPPVPEHRC
jgi:hypothetical protein